MKSRTNLRLSLDLIKLVGPLSFTMFLAIFFGTLGHLSATLIPVLGAISLLEVMGIGLGLGLSRLFVLVAVLALFRGIFRYLEQYCNHHIAFKLLALIREKVFSSLRKLCPAKLEGRDKGDLISLITSDVELMEVFFAHTISPVAIACLMALILCTLLWWMHPLLSLIALFAYVSVGIVIPMYTAKRSKNSGARHRKEAGALSAFILDSLRGLSEILQFGRGKERLEKMMDKTEELSQIESEIKKEGGRAVALTQIVILLFDLLMLFGGIKLYLVAKIDFSQLLVSLLVLMSSFGPFVSLAALGSGLQGTFASANRVLDLLDESPETKEIEGKASTDFRGAKATEISFSYDKEQILEDMSVDFPKDTVVGILGKSGSGKSTLLKLLMRFWDVDKGKLEISGKNIKEINTRDLRKMQAYVTQETHLFQGSIEDNLRIAHPCATNEELEKACKEASIHEFIIGLPKGYDSQVGELGDRLSGGERQRLGLARAFLHGAPFLLLDEPTSNLDSLNEAVILRSIAQHKKNRTVVLVSHRASTMKLAETVYCVEKGRMS